MHDLTTQLVHGAGITISLFLDGMADVTIGGRTFLMGPAANGGEVEGVMIARGEPDLFRRRGRQGMHVRKVNVSLPFDWLDGEGLEDISGHSLVRALVRDHLSSARFRPSARIVALCEQVLRPSVHGALLSTLHLESRVLEIAAEALAILGQDAPSAEARPCCLGSSVACGRFMTSWKRDWTRISLWKTWRVRRHERQSPAAPLPVRLRHDGFRLCASAQAGARAEDA